MPPSLEERLERGELILFPHCPFALPTEADIAFLQQQRLRRWTHKNISYNPITQRVTGYQRTSREQKRQFRRIMGDFSRACVEWAEQVFPRYRSGCLADRASYRSEEEATRRLRHSARNDLLHIDAFPNRPSQGRRILRLYVNINPTEPRVWVTSDGLPQLVDRYGSLLGLPDRPSSTSLPGWRERLLRWMWPGYVSRSPYDSFLLHLHDFLKTSDDFQERSRKRLWSFPPGSMWILYTDARAHAELRGQYALEHSFFVTPEVLVVPECAPASYLGFSPMPGQKRAA